MRMIRRLFVLAMLALAAQGCIMVIDTGLDTPKVGKHKRIVEIDGTLYVVDLKNNTARKLEGKDLEAVVEEKEITSESTSK